jgi:hypothetical protein
MVEVEAAEVQGMLCIRIFAIGKAVLATAILRSLIPPRPCELRAARNAWHVVVWRHDVDTLHDVTNLNPRLAP